VRRNSKRPLPRLCTTFRRDRVNVAAHLVGELAAPGEPPAERLDEPIIALPPFGLSGGQRGVWQWRRASQPKAHEHRQRLVGNADVPFDALQVARDAIKPACESGLQPIGAVGRQVRGERRFDDERLRHTLTIGVVGELAGEVRRQAEGVLRPHARSHSKIVGAIERRLARGGAEVALHDPLALRLVVRLVIQRCEFLDALTRPRDDFFVLR